MSAPLWLIWSHEHTAFWRPNECGYTKFIQAAGRYTRERAEAICRNAGLSNLVTDAGIVPNEICFPAPEMADELDRALLRETELLARLNAKLGDG